MKIVSLSHAKNVAEKKKKDFNGGYLAVVYITLGIDLINGGFFNLR